MLYYKLIDTPKYFKAIMVDNAFRFSSSWCLLRLLRLRCFSNAFFDVFVFSSFVHSPFCGVPRENTKTTTIFIKLMIDTYSTAKYLK